MSLAYSSSFSLCVYLSEGPLVQSSSCTPSMAHKCALKSLLSKLEVSSPVLGFLFLSSGRAPEELGSFEPWGDVIKYELH